MSKQIVVRMRRGEDKTFTFTNDLNGNPINFANYTIVAEGYLYQNNEVYALGTDPGYGPDFVPQFNLITVNNVQTAQLVFSYEDMTGMREREVYWKVIGTDKTTNLRTVLLDGYVQLMY